MIGFRGVRPPVGDSVGTRLLGALPASPATELAAAAVRCDHEPELDAVLEWYGDMRAARPPFAVLLVADHRFGGMLASCPHPVVSVVPPSTLEAGGLPRHAMDELRTASVEGRVLDRLVVRFGWGLMAELSVVRCLVAYAVRGGTVSRAARDLGVSLDTVRRRLAAAGVRPRDFMRAARILAYDQWRTQGATPLVALAACGWTDPEHVRRTRRRDEAAAFRGG
jgi:hypothetical protein